MNQVLSDNILFCNYNVQIAGSGERLPVPGDVRDPGGEASSMSSCSSSPQSPLHTNTAGGGRSPLYHPKEFLQPVVNLRSECCLLYQAG
jgi:hypothetical protein